MRDGVAVLGAVDASRGGAGDGQGPLSVASQWFDLGPLLNPVTK